ncbi:hypothetical protein BDZ89DRAFT_1068889 [Hymenopellis radicata]|nr:hypothetical protein BDZ89DRAFT_1068889 [Hymenopellis radicata]
MRSDATIQEIQQDIKVLLDLVVPEEWKDPTHRPESDKQGAADFREAVVGAATTTPFKRSDGTSPFKGSDDRDSRAILWSMSLLVALSRAAESRDGWIGKNEVTFRRHMDALVADVFDVQFLIDGEPEFGDGNFCVVHEEPIWLQENYVSTSKAHPDAIVAYGPINADAIHRQLRDIQMPTATDANPASTTARTRIPQPLSQQIVNLYSNVHFQYRPSTAIGLLYLIAVLFEHKTSKHRFEQLCMDFTTAQLQRRALHLKERILFGFALGDDGVSVYASFWSNGTICVSQSPVHVFSFSNNIPLQVLRLFLFLRRLAKKIAPDLKEDELAIISSAKDIASELVKGTTIWRTSPGPPGPSRSRSSGSNGPSPKRRRLTDTGNATDVADTNTLTAQNLSGFNQCEGTGGGLIEHWVARVKFELAMTGEPSCMMEDLDEEDPCMDGEVLVPALEDAEATFEMSPKKVQPFCTAIPISPPLSC